MDVSNKHNLLSMPFNKESPFSRCSVSPNVVLSIPLNRKHWTEIFAVFVNWTLKRLLTIPLRLRNNRDCFKHDIFLPTISALLAGKRKYNLLAAVIILKMWTKTKSQLKPNTISLPAYTPRNKLMNEFIGVFESERTLRNLERKYYVWGWVFKIIIRIRWKSDLL